MVDENLSSNPFYPIELDDYPKLFDFVLTANGLMYFQELKRKYVLGKEMSNDEHNKLRLLYIYYATDNKNKQAVSIWQEICASLDKKGITEHGMIDSKDHLIKSKMIVGNPSYQPGVYRRYVQYIKRLQSKNNT